MKASLADHIGLWVPMAIWLASFFMAAITPEMGGWHSDDPNNDILPGFMAAFFSVVQFGFIWQAIRHGSPWGQPFLQVLLLIASSCAWFANLSMFVAPTFFRRIRSRKGGVYLGLLLCWFFLIVVLPLFGRSGVRTPVNKFHYGYFVWGGSILFMAFFLLGLRLQAAALPFQGRSQ
jgi:hypothetical protein